MKPKECTHCGGVLVAESLGWRCKSCRGFISSQDGKFYEYVEKPFMPPMTNADRYRAMSDEELARAFAQTGNCPPSPEYGHNCDRCGKCWLDYLRQPVKEDEQ